MSRNWAHERWRKQFIREPLQERLWSVVARGLREYLRIVAEDDGTLLCEIDDPISSLVRALGPRPDEMQFLRDAVRVLLQSGFLVHENGRLWIPSLPESQAWQRPSTGDLQEDAPDVPAEASRATQHGARSSTERVRAHRARKRAEHGATVASPVPPDVSAPVPNVTSSVSCNVSVSRGDRKQDPSHSSNIQKDLQIDHPHQTDVPVTSPVSVVASSVSGEAATHVSGTHDEDDEGEDDREKSNTTIEEVLEMPIQKRATLVVDSPDLARRVKPHTWPEVVAVAHALAEAEGQTNALLTCYEHDRGVRNLVALYATGVSQEDLESVARTVPKQIWWTASGKPLGLESLTINVVRRNRPKPLAHTKEPSRRVAEVLAWLERERRAG